MSHVLGGFACLVACWAQGALPAATGSEKPRDQPYAGMIHLAVDASDVRRRIITVHETISGLHAGTTLLYPKWLPGTHAPEGPIDRLAGLTASVKGVAVRWERDPLDAYALRITLPSGTTSVDLAFQYLSPTSAKVGPAEISREMLLLEWNTVVLYPAGYFGSRIPVSATVTLPAGWAYGTALEVATVDGASTTFKPVSLETLVDSPIYAGLYSRRLDLDPGSSAPVRMNLFADRAEYLSVKDDQLEQFRALVQQAYKLFGAHHYSHYDFLFSLSNQIAQIGLEHHQSSEDGADPEFFTEWSKNPWGRDLLGHEFTHSWNGKFRRPADLWTPNYNVPMQDSLLWVYEGQTQYWGEVLTARSGLWSRAEALDELAMTAAFFDMQAGRGWRSLQDTTNDEIINPRRPQSWTDWQRFEDYYSEGQLIWLDVDTLIRERSGDTRSLDDFALRFFGINDGSFKPVTYTFEDLVRELNVVEPYDWATFLRQRLDRVAIPAPLDGIRRGGYQLRYDDTESDFLQAAEAQAKRANFSFSIGMQIDDSDGTVTNVAWGSAAYKADVTESAQVLAVNGVAYTAAALKDALRRAQSDAAPIELIMRTGERYWVTRLDYHEGLKYPHLVRDSSVPARLDAILSPRN